jgi:hypothetical protein
MMKENAMKKGNDCPYCKGIGYFQLLLGGSETCQCCKGSGEGHYELAKTVISPR